MFTGIVESKGTLLAIEPTDGDCRLRVDCGDMNLADCRTGDSISVSGVCLTMLELEQSTFTADASRETIDLTTLGNLQSGGRVNLELALAVSDRLGGHMVSGHVDGKGRLQSRRQDGRAYRFDFELPSQLARYAAKKGSICIDGVSLTINDIDGARFSVCLIPHTLEVTTLGNLRPGDEVNIEVDLIARYLERLVDFDLNQPVTGEIRGQKQG
jgi:riboflavin synthase